MDREESLKRHAKHGGKWPGNVLYDEWKAAYEIAQKEEMERLSKKWAWSRQQLNDQDPRRPKNGELHPPRRDGEND